MKLCGFQWNSWIGHEMNIIYFQSLSTIQEETEVKQSGIVFIGLTKGHSRKQWVFQESWTSCWLNIKFITPLALNDQSWFPFKSMFIKVLCTLTLWWPDPATITTNAYRKYQSWLTTYFRLRAQTQTSSRMSFMTLLVTSSKGSKTK